MILCSYGITYNVKCVFMVVFVLLKIRFFQKYGFSMVFHYLTENTYIINYLNFGENNNDCKTDLEFVIWNIFLSCVACIFCKAWVHSMKSAYRSQTPSHCIHFVFYIPSILCISLDFEHTTTETMLLQWLKTKVTDNWSQILTLWNIFRLRNSPKELLVLDIFLVLKL